MSLFPIVNNCSSLIKCVRVHTVQTRKYLTMQSKISNKAKVHNKQTWFVIFNMLILPPGAQPWLKHPANETVWSFVMPTGVSTRL